MGRAPCCDKANVKKGPWSPEEDAKLKSYIEKYGTGGNWIALPQKIGLKRCGKSCRLRWLNYLRPDIKHGGFTEEEDYIISSLYISIGSRWSIIAAQLPGRTDNDIKNYWNTKLKKKLLGRRRHSTALNPLSKLNGPEVEHNSAAQVLTNSALERFHLHILLQNPKTPLSFYPNPSLQCPDQSTNHFINSIVSPSPTEMDKYQNHLWGSGGATAEITSNIDTPQQDANLMAGFDWLFNDQLESKSPSWDYDSAFQSEGMYGQDCNYGLGYNNL